MGAEHVVAGVVAFSLTKKLVILGTVNLYGVGRLYRHALKAAKRTQVTPSFPSSCPVAPVWRTPIAEGFKYVARLPRQVLYRQGAASQQPQTPTR